MIPIFAITGYVVNILVLFFIIYIVLFGFILIKVNLYRADNMPLNIPLIKLLYTFTLTNVMDKYLI